MKIRLPQIIFVVVPFCLSGCAFPGDTIHPRTDLLGTLRGPAASARTVSVAQLRDHPSRLELRTFAAGDWSRVPLTKATGIPIHDGSFLARFSLYMYPDIVWVVPPLPSAPSSPDYVIRFDSQPAVTFLLRHDALSSVPRLYRVDADSGSLSRSPGGAVSSTDGFYSCASGRLPVQTLRVAFPMTATAAP